MLFASAVATCNEKNFLKTFDHSALEMCSPQNVLGPFEICAVRTRCFVFTLEYNPVVVVICRKFIISI